MADPTGALAGRSVGCYGGHREADLAMLSLFGSHGLKACSPLPGVPPLAEGWGARRALPAAAAARARALFGGSYSEAANRVARRYAG